MANEKENVLYVSVFDEGKTQLVKAVLSYESMRRGLSRGQTLLQLVKEAVNVDAYPPEVRKRLAEIEDEMRRRAVEVSLDASDVKVA